MLRSAELNTLSMTITIYRDLVCRANGGICRLSCGTPWRYDGKASCTSKKLLPCCTGFGTHLTRRPPWLEFKPDNLKWVWLVMLNPTGKWDCSLLQFNTVYSTPVWRVSGRVEGSELKSWSGSQKTQISSATHDGKMTGWMCWVSWRRSAEPGVPPSETW